MSNENIRWGSEGGLQEEPPQRIKDFGYTTSTGDVTGTSEAPILQWTNWQFAQTYTAINDLTNLVNSGGGSGGSGGGVNIIKNGDFTGGNISWDFPEGIDEFEQNTEPDALSGFSATWTPSLDTSCMISDKSIVPIRISNKIGAVSFQYQTDSNDFGVEVYESGSDDKLLYTYPITSTPSGLWMDFIGQVELPSEGTELYIKFVTSAIGSSIDLSNVQLGTTDSVAEGAIITEWVDFEFTLNNAPAGTTSTYSKKRRVGENLEIIANFQFGSGGSASILGATVPDGLHIMDSDFDYLVIGHNLTSFGLGAITPSNPDDFYFRNGETGQLLNASQLDGGQMAIQVQIPIEEWKNEGAVTFFKSQNKSKELAGEIIEYAGSDTPNGWLDCDGSTYRKIDFPDLYGVIGDTYNTAQYVGNDGTISTYAEPDNGDFRLPDLRNIYTTSSESDGLGSILSDTTAVNGLNAGSSSITVNKNQWNSNQNEHRHAIGGSDTNSTYYALSSKSNNVTQCQSGTSGVWGVRATASAPLQSLTRYENASWSSANATGTASAQALTGDAVTRPNSIVMRKLIRCWNSNASVMGVDIASSNEYGLIKLDEQFASSVNEYGLQKIHFFHRDGITNPPELFNTSEEDKVKEFGQDNSWLGGLVSNDYGYSLSGSNLLIQNNGIHNINHRFQVEPGSTPDVTSRVIYQLYQANQAGDDLLLAESNYIFENKFAQTFEFNTSIPFQTGDIIYIKIFATENECKLSNDPLDNEVNSFTIMRY